MPTPLQGPEPSGIQGYAPAPGQAPYPGQGFASSVEAPKQRNIIGIIGLIVAILGVIFSCVKGALILGWLLLPIAFILGIIGLFGKNKKKGTAITAVVLSIVGTILAVVVFLAVIGESFEEATGGETIVSDGTSNEAHAHSANAQNFAASSGDAVDASSEESNTTGAADSSRENPLPLGATVENDEWTLTVNSVNLNADEIVAAGNMFNEPPAEGMKYIIVNISQTLKAGDSEGSMPEGSVEYVSAEGNTYNSYDAWVALDSEFDSLSTLYEGATATGDLVFEVPAENADQGVLAVRPAVFADKKFVSLN